LGCQPCEIISLRFSVSVGPLPVMPPFMAQ
jgi:hypothetical protein